MHIITGGAYNGKARWVKENYQLDRKSHTWISAYEEEISEVDLTHIKTNILVLEAVEHWILRELKNNLDLGREYGKVLIKQWTNWENEDSKRQLIVIGTDISKGIVPMSHIERAWRDLTGWFYQDLVEVSQRVDYIWYGIPKQIK